MAHHSRWRGTSVWRSVATLPGLGFRAQGVGLRFVLFVEGLLVSARLIIGFRA